MVDVDNTIPYVPQMEYVTKALRNVGDARVVNINIRLWYTQDFERFKELVREQLGWELNCNQVNRHRGDTYRNDYLCTAVHCF